MCTHFPSVRSHSSGEGRPELGRGVTDERGAYKPMEPAQVSPGWPEPEHCSSAMVGGRFLEGGRQFFQGQSGGRDGVEMG